MNWTKKINAILGFFWVTFWQDSWLIELIAKFFSYLLGKNLLGRTSSICLQTQCKSLYIPESIRYVRILVGSSNSSGIINVQDMVVGTSYVQQSTSTEAYASLQEFDPPSYFQLRVSQEAVKLFPGQDFNYYPDRGTIEFNKQLPEYGFSICTQTVGVQLKSCYELWAVYQEFKTLRDGFTGIMDLPSSWLWKYPGAIQAAWSIKQNGANQRDVKRLLGAIGGCPYSTVAGKTSVHRNTVTIEDTCYKGTGSVLVSDGRPVPQDTKLFTGSMAVQDIDKAPAVYTYKTGLPVGLPGIHVVTDVGVLYAPNQSAIVSNNMLPLLSTPGGSQSSAYNTLCAARNADTTIPYAELTSPLNPAQFIFSKVWGPAAVLIVTPPSNQQDMRKAVQFIAHNTALGTMLLAYMYDSTEPKLLYPDKQLEEELMIYYNTSVNNGTSYRERLGDFAE